MINYIYKLLIPLIFLSCTVACSSEKPASPQAGRGYIDLRNQDFHKNGNVPLDGEWNFSWMQKHAEGYQPPDLSSYNDYLILPGFWNSKTGTGFGYGWVGISIDTDGIHELGLKLRYAATACEIWINGKKAETTGVPGYSEDVVRPQTIPVFIKLPQAEKIDLAVFISNYHHQRGGPRIAPEVGLYDDMKLTIFRDDVVNSVILGILFIMFLYHLLLWFARREDSASLFFSFVCLLVFLRMSATGHFFSRMFPNHDLFEFSFKVEYISIALGWTFMLSFIDELFPGEINTRILRFFQTAGVILSVFPLVTRVILYSEYVKIYEVLILAASLLLIYTLVNAYRARREGAALLIGGFALMFAAIVIDILNANSLIHSPYIVPYGLVLFILSQSSVLAFRFAWAHKTAEHLSMNLKNEVEKKTVDLIARTEETLKAKSELELAYEKLNSVYSELNETYGIMKNDLTLARTIQDNLLPDPETGLLDFSFHIEYIPAIEIGGDIYDFTEIDGKLRVFISDAVGHGIGAALITTLIKGEYDRVKDSGEPHEVFHRLAEIFSHSYPSLQIYFTAFIADIDPINGNLKYASCGHPEQYLLREGEVVELSKTGYAIGLTDASNAVTRSVDYTRGDTVLLYTDGLTDMVNENHDQFGNRKLKDLLLGQGGNINVAEMVDLIISGAKSFAGSVSYYDDITIIGIK